MTTLKNNETKIYKILHRKHGFIKSNVARVVKFVDEKLENGDPSPKGATFYTTLEKAKEDIAMMVAGSYGAFGKFQKTEFTAVSFVVQKIERVDFT